MLAITGITIVNTNRFYTAGSAKYVYRISYILLLTILCLILQWVTGKIFIDNTAYLHFLKASLPVRFMFTLLMITFIAIVSELQFYQKQQSENKKRKEEASLLFRDAELASLRQQLQPHFLFNSLNSISSLIGSDAEGARKMIQQLADFLRGTLKKDESQMIPLAEELENLQLYLEIEKVRFGQRLQTNIVCDEDTKKLRIPSLLLQPVTENAIKFGLYDTTGKVTISISATTEANTLQVQVENPFDESTSKHLEGTGFGLSSINRRLYLLFARNDLLSATRKGNTFITTIRIPQAI